MALTVIHPREVKLVGELRVNRILPFRERRMVGPFIFLDEMNAVISDHDPTAGDILPHPHIGLSTLTYLFEGEIMHRDSLGTKQRIVPGEVNWMTAGKGIVHSERIPPDVRLNATLMHGMQAWIALPLDREECEPDFQHHSEVPTLMVGDAKVKVIAGNAFGATSPVRISSPLFYFKAELPQGETLTFNPNGQECGVYLVTGSVTVNGEQFVKPVLLVFDDVESVSITASEDTLCLFLGGERMDGHRHIYWNFVSSSGERIEEAKQAWREQRFDPVPDETEWVPLPGEEKDRDRTTLP